MAKKKLEAVLAFIDRAAGALWEPVKMLMMAAVLLGLSEIIRLLRQIAGG